MPSNRIIDATGIHYVYDIDTCQTAYLVEKIRVGENYRYIVTILYTKETIPFWIDAKLNVIMLRILIAEQNIPILGQSVWKIVGSIDCQKDRSYATNSYHQDSLLSDFIDEAYRFKFNNFLSDIFRPDPEHFNPNILPGVYLRVQPPHGSIRVQSFRTAHFGMLDYDSPVSIIAAAIRTATNYYFTILPPSTDEFRPFLFYLNSIIHHATPSKFTQTEIDQIIHWCLSNNTLIPGFNNIDEVRIALEEYNDLFDEAFEHPRNFRRLLGKILPTEEMRFTTQNERKRIREEEMKKQERKRKIIRSGDNSNPVYSDPNDDKDIDTMTIELKTYFQENANNIYINNDENFIEDRYPEKADNLKFTYAERTYSLEQARRLTELDIDQPQPQLQPAIGAPVVTQIKRFSIPINALDNAAEHVGGRSKRNKSKRRRNTKKKYHFKKRKQTQRKQNKKRRSKKH
jgi:hypothetical protein